MLSYLSVPKTSPETGIQVQVAYRRWSQEAQVAAWEVTEVSEGSQYRMYYYWVGYPPGGKQSSLLLETWKGRVGHTGQSYSTWMVRKLGYLSNQFLTAIGWGLLQGWGGVGEGGINALVLQCATWASVTNESLNSERVLRQRNVNADSWESGGHELMWKDKGTKPASAVIIKQKCLKNQCLYYRDTWVD